MNGDDMLRESDVIDQFRRAMAEYGIGYDGEIIGDGKIRRFQANTDKKRRGKGWYLLYLDGKPSGAFGHYKLLGGQKGVKWTCDTASEKMTPEDRRRLAQEAARKKREREAEERARHAEAALRANAIWQSATEADDHPYLKRKGVKSYGLRVGKWELLDRETGELRLISNRALLVPVRDTAKQIHALQAIFPNDKNPLHRDKDYLADSRKQGLFYTIGKPQKVAIGGVERLIILLCEGYSTGGSLHEATGHAVVVGFDAGNLLPVAIALRDKFPDALLVFCADNDQWVTNAAGVHTNPGVTHAKAAANAVGGLLAIPPFKYEDATEKDGKKIGPTDFNDLHLRDGLEAVRTVIHMTIFPPPTPPAEESSEQASPGEEKPPAEPPEEEGPIKNGYFSILGYDHDRYFIFQHEKRQICICTKGDFSEAGLIELAPLMWWEMNFPGEKSSINKKAALNFIMRAAHARGIYDISRIRGRGAWHDDGRFVFHHGDHLSVDGEHTDITQIRSRYVYELDRSLPKPAVQALTDDEGSMVLDVAKRFRWTKPGSAALLAGFVVLAPLCGALQWRPHIWLSGGAGSGKTTVLKGFVHHLMNGIDVFAQGNSTEAGIRQTLRADALPVLFDESEQNDDREKMRVQSILSLIRQASTDSEARTLKGTAGGEAMGFHIRSMFCLASIQVGIKYQADIERISVLSIRSKREDKTPAETWKYIKEGLLLIQGDKTLPARLFRRSLDLLPVIHQNIQVFTEVAAQRFGSQRDGDQYGTLLAGCWSLTSRMPVTYSQAEQMIDQYDWSEHMDQHDSEESERAMAALMGSQIRLQGGAVVTIYEILRTSAGHQDPNHDGVKIPYASADTILQRYGMRVVDDYLLLSNVSQELQKLMNDTPFGADLRGVLLRARGASRYENRSVRFNGVASKCIAIPIGDILRNADAVPPPAPAPQTLGQVSDEFSFLD